MNKSHGALNAVNNTRGAMTAVESSVNELAAGTASAHTADNRVVFLILINESTRPPRLLQNEFPREINEIAAHDTGRRSRSRQRRITSLQREG
jgi:hypothetical protein